jgi:concentrative nucleoside transporter, CNT family
VERLTGIFGIIALMGIAYALSNNRKAIKWRTVGVGVVLQMFFAIIVLRTKPGEWLFEGARKFISSVLSFTDYGAHFLFGNLYVTSPGIAGSLASDIPPGGLSQGFQVMNPASGQFVEVGTIFAFHVLPTIIFFGSIMALMYHLGIMQKLVQGFAWVMTRAMGTSGAESLSAASNIFVGQTEAPFVVKPFLKNMTQSEIMAVMTCGFATVAGGVLAAYVRFGVDPGHLLAASVMSAPAALVMAKIIIPETGIPETGKSINIHVKKQYSNVIDAAASGASDGLKLAVNVAAMLLAFIAIVAMFNGFLGWVGGLFGFAELSIRLILGWMFSPLALLMGVSWADVLDVGYLMGAKISINEFVAYIDLVALKGTISDRSFVIATYALCGFANFSSIAIQIGGISALVPERRADLSRLGFRAMIAGALASFQTAAIAGILYAG